jgi:aryl-alcohol dehydrogenase-like predicted oxidoreductase
MQIQLPAAATLELRPGLRICRLVNGLWQLSGAHGFLPDARQAVADMKAYHAVGLTTWDLADHYGPAEEYIGQFRRTLLNEADQADLDAMLAFTKWVPRPGKVTRRDVERAMNLSRQRMDMPTLDMVQFHWWEYADPAYLDALHHMADMQAEGKLRFLSLTNFDTEHTARIVADGIPIVTNQVQYSIIDRRPEVKMVPYCTTQGITLLTYGTLMGGLLTDRYLGKPEPGYHELTTASLRKYKNMIDAWGDWALFQELLRALREIADQHGVSIANVATQAMLAKPGVAGVIVGARLGHSNNRQENLRVFSFALAPAETARIDAISAKGRDLFKVIGDCGDEYRR